MTEDEIKALKASRQSSLEGAITPTNGRGGYAPRYSPPPITVKPPTWDYWRHMPTVKPWQACALALNIEPDSVDYRPKSWDGQPETWDGFPSHFIKLLQLLDANQFEKQHFTENFSMGVRLSEFAAWCAHVGFAIPPELSALAALPERPQVAPKVVAQPVTSPSGDDMEEQAPAADDHDEILAALFDPMPVEALAKMFPTDNDATTAQWRKWADKAKANGLIDARENRKFNPYKAGKWFVSKGARGWDTVRLYRTLAKNLPPRSRDDAHLLTGWID